MLEVQLTKNQKALVHENVFEWVNQWNWYAQWNPSTRSFYACRKISTGKSNPRQTNLKMERALWEYSNGPIPEGFTLDHINHDTLDNRIENLRLADPKQQGQNQRIPKNNTTGFKGVSWNKAHQKYKTEIRVSGKTLFLGYFENAVEAREIHRVAELEHYGEFARSDEEFAQEVEI